MCELDEMVESMLELLHRQFIAADESYSPSSSIKGQQHERMRVHRKSGGTELMDKQMLVIRSW